MIMISVSVFLMVVSILVMILPAQITPVPDNPVAQLIANKNPNLVAESLITKHYFTMHLAAILLLSSAIGALMLVHSGRKGVQKTQQEVVEEKCVNLLKIIKGSVKNYTGVFMLIQMLVIWKIFR